MKLPRGQYPGAGAAARSGRSSVQGEDVKHGTRLYGFQFRCRIDKPLVPGPTLPDQDGDVLLPIGGEGHRRRIHAAAGVEAPQRLQGLGVERGHLAVRLAVEHQVRGRQQAAQHRIRRLELADFLPGGDIDRGHAAGDALVLIRAATGEHLTLGDRRAGLDRFLGDPVAALDHRDVPLLQRRIIGRRRPVLAAHVARAGDGYQVVLARHHGGIVGLHRQLWIVLGRLAGFRVQALGPGQLLDERQTPEERPVVAIHRVGEAVAVGLEVDMRLTPVHRRVDQHVLGHAVIVERVVRGVLEMPLDLAGIGISEDQSENEDQEEIGVEYLINLDSTTVSTATSKSVSSNFYLIFTSILTFPFPHS